MKKTVIAITILGSVIALFSLNSCIKEKGEIVVPVLTNCDTTVSITYTNSIASILSNSCNSVGCHEAGSVNGDFTTYAGIYSKITNASLDDRVFVTKDMPPAASPQLDACSAAKIKKWINAGGPQ